MKVSERRVGIAVIQFCSLECKERQMRVEIMFSSRIQVKIQR